MQSILPIGGSGNSVLKLSACKSFRETFCIFSFSSMIVSIYNHHAITTANSSKQQIANSKRQTASIKKLH
jgi:hypothetical protein